MELYFGLNVIILLPLKSGALLNTLAQLKDAFVCFHDNKTKNMEKDACCNCMTMNPYSKAICPFNFTI
jgi:hypothetical protein